MCSLLLYLKHIEPAGQLEVLYLLFLSCQYRIRANDSKFAGYHSACKNLRLADGEIFQSRGHARRKQAASTS